MSRKLIAAAVALASLGATTAHADIIDSSMFSVKGFGTVGVVHSSEDEADFVATPYQPNGAGLTRSSDMGVDSKLGVQLNANFTEKLTAVVQAVSQHQYDNSWTPQIEWANVKYQFTPQFSMRLGRVVLPAFLISDSRMVGYANTWVRPPEEIYSTSPITNSDGADLTYHMQFGEVTNTLGAFYGTTTAKLPQLEVDADSMWGINDAVEIGDWTFRASYVSQKFDIESDDLEPFYAGLDRYAAALSSLNYSAQAAQARAMGDKYSLEGIQTHIYTVGFSYDPGQWFALGEYLKFDTDSMVVSRDGFYVTAGYRAAKFTPYVTYAQVKGDRRTTDGISPEGLPTVFADGAVQLTDGMNQVLSGNLGSQRSTSIGVRWDFMPNADLKAQFERKNLLDDSAGKLINTSDDFEAGDDFNVISLAVDFVF